MNIPKFWTTIYKHDRRLHRHRCFACNHILTAGEFVFMARVGDSKKTRTVHIDCADKLAGCEGDRERLTYRQLLMAQAS